MKRSHAKWALILLAGVMPTVHAAVLPTDVTILTEKDFIARNVFSVADALRSVPSLKLEEDGSRGTRVRAKMRGLSSNENVMVLMDGRPLMHEYDSDVDLAQFPIGMVDRIEITRGGSSVLYSAQAVAGSINIITLRPGQKGLVADLGTGVGRGGEKNSIGKILARSNLGDLTYAPSVEESGGFSRNEHFETTNHFGNFTRSFNGKGYWGAEYYFHDSEVGVSNGTPVPFDQWNTHLEKQPSTPYQRTQESQHAKVFMANQLPLGGTTYLAVTQSWRSSDDRASDNGVSLRDVKSQTSTLDFSWHGGAVDAGFQTKKHKRKVFPEDPHDVYENGVFVAAKWNSNRFTVVPGLRLDHHSKSGEFLAPRLALIYAPAEALSFSGTVQRAHRNPNFDELFSSSTIRSNPELNDEQSWSSDAGVHWTPGKWGNIKTTAFQIQKTNVIAPDASSQLQNGGDERTGGLEAELMLRAGKKDEQRWELTGNMTRQRSKRSLPTTSGYVQSAMTPRTLAYARLDKHFRRKMMLTNEVRYQSEQYELDNRLGVRIPSFYTWNARFSLRILAADMYFAVDNITKRRYAEALGQLPLSGGGTTTVLSPHPGQTFWTGVSIRFIN